MGDLQQKQLPSRKHSERLRNIDPKPSCKGASNTKNLPRNQEIRKDTKGKEAPLVASADESADEVRDGIGPDGQDGEKDSSPSNTSEELESPEDECKVDGVSHPSGVKDLPAGVLVTSELRGNWCRPQVGGEGVVIE